MDLEEKKPSDILLEKIKQETEDLFENIKKEPIDEECFEGIVPKIEEDFEPLETSYPRNPVQKYLIQTQKALPNLEIKQQDDSAIMRRRNRRCSVCRKIYICKSMKLLSLGKEKLLFMTGCILRGDYSLEEAQLIMSKNCPMYTCHFHFSDAINQIYKILNIANHEEITSRSDIVLSNVMILVNTLCPEFSTVQFCNVLHDWTPGNTSPKRDHTSTENQKRRSNQRNCRVCSQSQERQSLKFMTLEEERLVIIIGCILRGEYSLKQAQLFFSQKSNTLICRSHFLESLNEIYRALRITSAKEIHSCSAKLMKHLMITVNSLHPEIETTKFCDILHGFALRNTGKIRVRSVFGDPNKDRKTRCSVCSQIQFRKNMKYISLDNEKLAVIVGCIFQGDFTLEQAQFLSIQKSIVICNDHLVEATNAIYDVLQIRGPYEILTCSLDPVENVITAIKSVCPQATIPYFRYGFRDFVVRNSYHLAATI